MADRGVNEERRSQALILVLAVAVVVLAIVAYREHRSAATATREIGLDATRMVAEAFAGKRDLRVGQLSGTVLARTQYDGMVFHPSQQTRAPVTVDYLLDLDRIGDADLAWDADRRVMTVRIPDVSVEPPRIDMARAEVRQDGVWVGRKAGQAMQREASRRIGARAVERASAPENLARARERAVDAVTRMVRQPLTAAGLPGVTVTVRFPWQGGASTEQWDRSRAPAEIVANGA